MRALTLTQPWTTLVAIGQKSIETRSWWTSYRGLLAVHAAKGFPRACKLTCRLAPFREVLVEAGYIDPGNLVASTDRLSQTLPLGAVVAICRLADCVPTHKIKSELSEQELAFGDYSAGRYAWLLADVRALPEPIAATGALGLWQWQPPQGLALPAQVR